MTENVLLGRGHPRGHSRGFEEALEGEQPHRKRQVEVIWASDLDISCTPPCGVT